MRLIAVIVLGFSICNSVAQVYPQTGARGNGMGTSTLCLVDSWSIYNNPGSFGMLDHHEVGVVYENRFLVKELSTQSLTFGYHTAKAGNFGVHFQQFGFNLYRETLAGLSYGMKLFKNFSAGVQLNYHRVALTEFYGSKNALTAGVGLFYRFNESLEFGVRALNISRTRLADPEDERLPTTFGLGAAYHFGENVLWTAEVEKTLVHKFNFKSGIEFKPHKIVALRLGVNSRPFQTSFGLGLKLKKFQFDMSAAWHSTLGLSPSAGLMFSF